MTTDSASLFAGLPSTLRDELISEYRGLVNNFYEGRWRPAELQAGRFCEVVFTIIAARSAGAYPNQATKPDNFVQACRNLENSPNLERGLRILAGRILPGLYEIRNNRDVGHVGGDVDPNFMDSSYVVAASSWLMGELIRVFHSVGIEEAKTAVDDLSQIRTPAVWVDNDIRRVLNPETKLSDQVLLLVASKGASTNISNIIKWTEAKDKSYLKKVIATLHKSRMIEAANPDVAIKLLPAGAARVGSLLQAK